MWCNGGVVQRKANQYSEMLPDEWLLSFKDAPAGWISHLYAVLFRHVDSFRVYLQWEFSARRLRRLGHTVLWISEVSHNLRPEFSDKCAAPEGTQAIFCWGGTYDSAWAGANTLWLWWIAVPALLSDIEPDSISIKRETLSLAHSVPFHWNMPSLNHSIIPAY